MIRAVFRTWSFGRDPFLADGMTGKFEQSGDWKVDSFNDLPNQGSFPDLARAGNGLDVAPRFAEPVGKLGCLRTLKGCV